MQLQAPFINIQDELTLVTGAEACTLAVSVDSNSANKVASVIVLAGEIQVQTTALKADELFSAIAVSCTI